MKKIKTAAICGMGALGMMYGTRIADALGEGSVYFVMDGERKRRYSENTFYKNGEPCALPMLDADEAGPVDLVIVAVKYPGLADALDTIKRCVGEDTVIMSVLNGITSEDVIAERYGRRRMVYTVAQGTDAVKLGYKFSYANIGELRIGARYEDQKGNVRAVTEFLDAAGIPYVVEYDIMRRIWSKFMFNVGLNQACMVYETDYGGCSDENSEAYRVMVSAMREVIAVAECEGIDIGERTLCDYVRMIKTLTPGAMPSMRQDAILRRPSEVEIFAGTVRELAKKHDILVPTNDFLYRRIKETEAAY